MALSRRVSLGKKRYLFLGLVTFLLCIVIQVPATLLASVAQDRVPGLSMNGVSGSFWRGRASEVIVPIAGVSYSLGTLQWQVKPWHLLALQLCLDAETNLNQQRAEGDACMSITGALSISDTDMTVPAVVASLWQPLEADGVLSLHINEAEVVDGQWRHLAGSGSWQGAKLQAVDRWYDLGSFGARFDTNEQGQLAVNVVDASGPFEVKVNVNSDMQTQASVKGQFRGRQALAADIQQALAVMGLQERDGFYQLDQQIHF